jgi:hypothetical protein
VWTFLNKEDPNNKVEYEASFPELAKPRTFGSAGTQPRLRQLAFFAHQIPAHPHSPYQLTLRPMRTRFESLLHKKYLDKLSKTR